jgi:RNA polymerase sigma factor (sigma-70 family)
MSATDHEMLRRYAKENCEEAFAELTRRHLDLAWGAAVRITGDADLARDVAQKTFCDLARKARFIPESVVIPGWIYRAACLEARRTLRTLARRAERERKAMELHATADADPATEEWVATLLSQMDAALCSLRTSDRDALLLRFFEKKSLAEVGVELGVSEDTAQKRVSRALGKLRSRMTKGAVATSAALISQALGAASLQAAPVGLVGSISATSVGSAGVGGLSSILFNLKTQIIFMKTKLIVGTIALTAVAAPLAVQQQILTGLENENVRLSELASRATALQAANASLAGRDALAREGERLGREHEELLKLRAEVAALTTEENKTKASLRSRSAGLKSQLAHVNHEKELYANDGWVMAKIVSESKQLGLASRIFANENGRKKNERRVPANFLEFKEAGYRGSEANFDHYEFYPGAEGEEMPAFSGFKMLLREKQPRPIKGGWQRIYTLFDGSVQAATSETTDFTAWETDQHEKRKKALAKFSSR